MPTSSTCSRPTARRDGEGSSPTTGSTHLELEFLMDWFLDPGRRAPRRVRPRRAGCSSRRPPRCRPHHVKVGNIPGTPCDARPAHGAVRRAVRRRGAPPRRDDRLRVHAVRRQRPGPRHGAGAGRGRRRGQRRPGDRHVAHEQARHRARRTCGASRSDTCPGSSSTTAASQDMPDLVDETVNHRRLPGEGEFDVRGYVDACRRAWATQARGESRCSRRSCATCRWRRSSRAPTRPPAPSFRAESLRRADR